MGRTTKWYTSSQECSRDDWLKLAKAAADDVLSQIQEDLARDPERGDVVQGTGGLRKARVGNPRRHKGARGGFRYVFLYLKHKQHIHLLAILDKDEQDDFTNDERKQLKSLVDAIKAAN